MEDVIGGVAAAPSPGGVAAAPSPDGVAAAPSPDEVELMEGSVLRRASMLDEMPAETYERVVQTTLALIERRFRKMQEVINVASPDVNLNPFLMLAMAPAYNIYSPYEAAEYTQNAKSYHGDATAFGKFVEKQIFEIFGVAEPPEKSRDKRGYSAIDGDLTVEGQRYLATWKAGPWTMNQAHANEMSKDFPVIYEQAKLPIILGVFYGTVQRLNNKPAQVVRNTGPYVHVLVGKDLWEFVTGVRDAHWTVYNAIREAQQRFAAAHGGKTFFEHSIEARLRLAESFREVFGLSGAAEDMWESIFRHSF
jgi:hypothetical protein